MKSNMTSPLTLLPKHTEFLHALRLKLSALSRRGWNWIDTLYSRLLYWNAPSSSYCFQSSASWEIQDCVRQVRISAVTNRPMSLLTRLSVKRSVLSQTRPSTISVAQRSAGYFSPSKESLITSTSPVTSGSQVQILSTSEEKLKD